MNTTNFSRDVEWFESQMKLMTELKSKCANLEKERMLLQPEKVGIFWEDGYDIFFDVISIVYAQYNTNNSKVLAILVMDYVIEKDFLKLIKKYLCSVEMKSQINLIVFQKSLYDILKKWEAEHGKLFKSIELFENSEKS